MNLFKNLFIFELANNHQGSVEHGLKIINALGEIAKRYGINAGAKLQYRDLDTFVHPNYRDRTDVPHIPRFFQTRLSDADFLTLVRSIKSNGMTTICTPFDEISIRKAVDHGIEILKVGSCSADDWPFLEALASAGKPLIISTGGLGLRQIDSLVSFFSHKEVPFALMHCVGIYPTPLEMLNMNFLGRMIKRYPTIQIGYSGHESPDNLDVVKTAVSKGATILERHVGVPTESITLNQYSMNPSETEAWVKSALIAHNICGEGEEKRVSEAETDSLFSLKRGVYAARPIRRGSLIGREDVAFAMPCERGQTSSGEFGQYRAQLIATRDYETHEPIFEKSEPDLIGFTREILHEAKGMINEANINVGQSVQLEISHHYGITNFRKTGSLFVNMIDRDYCKKLVVVFPGQEHPSHLHRVKEETFQLHWGDLDLKLDGKQLLMRPGERVLIRPGCFHSFSSRSGAIFEEISTRNINGDSYYRDEQIRALDPMQRKTILDYW